MKTEQELMIRVISDPHFISVVKRIIAGMDRTRSRQGRDWYDRLKEAKQLNSDYFLNNIEAIWNKHSQLSSEIRHVIKVVCDSAYYETLKHYGELEEAKENTN